MSTPPPPYQVPDVSACPQCGKRYRTTNLAVGTRLTCKVCSAGFVLAPPNKDTDKHPRLTPDGETKTGTIVRAGTNGVVPQTVDDILRLAGGNEKYIESKEIGRGGMGVIMRTTDRMVRRDVAMKIMRHDTNAVQRARFLEEAQVTGQLEHPGIVPVYDLHTEAATGAF